MKQEEIFREKNIRRAAIGHLPEEPLEPARRFGWHLCVNVRPEAA